MQNDDVGRLIEVLGIRDAPLVRRGARETLDFFRTVLRSDPFRWIDYIKGIDFHSDVRRSTLPSTTPLARYEQFETPGRPKPFAYFTKPGTSEMQLGTNYDRYRFTLWTTKAVVPVLISRAADIAFGGRSRPGGGVQYILASSSPLEKLREGARVHGA